MKISRWVLTFCSGILVTVNGSTRYWLARMVTSACQRTRQNHSFKIEEMHFQFLKSPWKIIHSFHRMVAASKGRRCRYACIERLVGPVAGEAPTMVQKKTTSLNKSTVSKSNRTPVADLNLSKRNVPTHTIASERSTYSGPRRPGQRRK